DGSVTGAWSRKPPNSPLSRPALPPRGNFGRGGGLKERMTDRLTRRAVLRGAAVAGAAALVRPSVSLAATGPVFSRYVGGLSGVGQTISAPRPFTLVGVQWSEPAAARIELRTRRGAAGGRWSP